MSTRVPVTFALLIATSSLLAADSPMFRGTPAHTGVSSSPAPALATLKWAFSTKARIVSTPAVADGVAYVGSADHRLYAIRVADGSQIWAFQTGLGVDASPAVAGGRVYVASRDGFVYAVSAASGELVWKFATGGERRFTAPGIHGLQPATEMMPDPFDFFLSSPTVVDGTVYIGSGDHRVYALDAATGAVRWSFETGDVVHATPAVADGVVYIGSWDRYLYALDAATGRQIWKFETGDDRQIYNQIGIASSAAVADGVVLVGCRDGHFYAVDAKTGRQRWAEDNKGGWVIASPAVRDGIVYFPTSDGTQFKAIRIATGELVWRTVNRTVSFSSPVIAGDRVYFGSHDGLLNVLDLRTGARVGSFATAGHTANHERYLDAEGRMNNAAIFTDRTLDSVVIGLDRQFTLGSVLSSPVIVDGVAYFGSTDGHLYAVQ
ncbi:MAG: PQQ-binding-like beta-propeller repeat protein [Vicinamibacterales bacterium]